MITPVQEFTGKERDAETGLDYFGARYYSGAQGKWTSPDPFNIIVDAESREQFDAYLAQPQTGTSTSTLGTIRSATQTRPEKPSSCWVMRRSGRRRWR